jgi:hypothetical protein
MIRLAASWSTWSFGQDKERKHMKQIVLSFALLAAFAGAVRADFLEPFTDSAAGKTVTGEGWVIADRDGKSGIQVVVFTDTGYRVLPATLAADIELEPVLGRKASITATIQKNRSLSVSEVVLSK